MPHHPSIPRSVLITGCSTGIGRATARMLKERGWTVVPTARKAEDLEALHTEGFDAIELDVACSDSVQAAAAQVLEQTGGELGALVNNAGFGQPGAMEDLTREAMEYQFQVNVFGMQELTNALIPTFRQQAAGRIVNISSVVGRMSVPFLGIYSASKFAMEAMSDALRIELRGSGVGVSLVEPGPIITHFRNTTVGLAEQQSEQVKSVFNEFYFRELKKRRDSQKQVGLINRPPEDVGKKIIHALESSRPKRRYCVTLPAYLGSVMRRAAPYALTDRILSMTRSKEE